MQLAIGKISIPEMFTLWAPSVEISAHVKELSVGLNYTQSYPAASLVAVVALYVKPQ